MKKTLLILGLAVLVVSLMLAGCEESEPNTTSSSSGSSGKSSMGDKMKEAVTKSSEKYTGFMEWKEGMWSEMEMDANGQKMTTKMGIIGVDGDTFIFQYIFESPGENIERVSQIWIDKDSRKVVKYVMDVDGKIICMDAGETPEDAVPAGQESYPEDFPGMSYKRYTTPKGDTVDAAVFNMGGSEVWVSSEVPFGMVKTVLNGKTVSRLVDFGTSGAKARISITDAENCQSMQDMANQMMADMQAGAMPSEDPYVPPNAGAEAIAPSGDAAAAPCAMCNNMPPAAKKACLASCS